MLNNYCNLNCEYCFANDVMEEGVKEISLEDFEWLLDFLKRSGNKRIGLIGGEPTLHPKFIDFVKKVNQREYIKIIQIYTNGLYSNRYNKIFKDISKDMEISLLINVNSYDDIGEEKYRKIEENLKELSMRNKERLRIGLGINFYKENQDFSYILKLAKENNINKIRWSLVVPNTREKRNIDVKEYYNKHVDNIVDFILECRKKGIYPNVDCNNIPICFLDDEQLRLIAMISESNLRDSICKPIIDVKPDMQAIRCFAMNEPSVNIKNFKNESDLRKYFIEKVDKKYKNIPLFEECKNCMVYQINNRSCGCLLYKKKFIE